MSRTRKDDNGETVQSVIRALMLMELMAKENSSVTLSELTHKAGLKITTVLLALCSALAVISFVLTMIVASRVSAQFNRHTANASTSNSLSEKQSEDARLDS